MSDVRTLTCIGGLNIDEWARPEGAVQLRASNPVQWTRTLGGVVTNAARSAAAEAASASLDLRVRLHAAVGDDLDSASLTTRLNTRHLDAHLHIQDAGATSRYSVILDDDGELLLGLAGPNLAEQISPSALQSAMQGCDAALLDANLSEAGMHSCVKAKAQHCIIAAMAVSPAKAMRLLSLAGDVDLLFCNRREALAMTRLNADSLALDLCKALGDLGMTRVVLTDGADPIHIHDNRLGITDVVPVPPVIIEHSVNGAGDAFAGACCAHWLCNVELADCVEKAGLPAAHAVLTGHAPAPSLN